MTKKKAEKAPRAVRRAIRELTNQNWSCQCDWHAEDVERIGRYLARAFGVKIKRKAYD